MHRYTPSTVSTVLNEYLREFQAKLEGEPCSTAERVAGEREGSGPAPQGARWSSTSTSTTCSTRWHPQNVAIDLDDGVKANYPKFGAALKKIPGLEAANE